MSSSLPPETLKMLSANDGHSTDTSSTSEKAFPPSEGRLYLENNWYILFATANPATVIYSQFVTVGFVAAKRVYKMLLIYLKLCA